MDIAQIALDDVNEWLDEEVVEFESGIELDETEG
jgi:hypothetical protein